MGQRRADEKDGRVLRGERNQERILEALYELVQGGVIEPTAEQVAERAGVGKRTVFRQFDDFEQLYRQLGERVHQEAWTMSALTPPTGDLAVDLSSMIHRRARVFEYLAPFRRAAALVRHTSQFLRDQETMFAALLRERLLAVVTPHLSGGADTLPPVEETLCALDLLLSYEAWDRLRVVQGLSPKGAESVLVAAASVLSRTLVPRSHTEGEKRKYR